MTRFSRLRNKYKMLKTWSFAPGEMRSIVMCMSVCLFVCLSARLVSQKAHGRTSRQLFVRVASVAVARSSSDYVAMCYVLPVLWMT